MSTEIKTCKAHRIWFHEDCDICVLMKAAKYVWEQLDQVYDAETFSDGSRKEYPFSGAGECMRRLQYAIERCQDGQ